VKSVSDVVQATDPLVEHGEGPIWDGRAGCLHWVDMLAGDVMSWEPPDGPIKRRHVATVAAAIRPRRAGGLVVATEHGFALLGADSDGVLPLVDAFDDPSLRMNDGGCDPQGRFYCGSMAYDFAPGRASLYQLDTDHVVHVALRGVTISNGLVWSLDGSTVYYIDTPTQRVDAFDFDATAGTFSERRTVVEIPTSDGEPDGMTIDVDGYLWVAMFGGAAVRRYSPQGRLDGVVDLPVSQVSSCAFGGANLDELYITTSREGQGEREPQAGALFMSRAGVRGVPVREYAG
jgi:sugar lactone lactonase YvrE